MAYPIGQRATWLGNSQPVGERSGLKNAPLRPRLATDIGACRGFARVPLRLLPLGQIRWQLASAGREANVR